MDVLHGLRQAQTGPKLSLSDLLSQPHTLSRFLALSLKVHVLELRFPDGALADAPSIGTVCTGHSVLTVPSQTLFHVSCRIVYPAEAP